MENCDICGQKCDNPITIKKDSKRLRFCSGDCEVMYEGQDKKDS